MYLIFRFFRSWYFTLIILSIISIYSIAIRLPNLGRPISMAHHEWLTAHTLITVDNFAQHGAFYYFLSPIYSYDNLGDRYTEIFSNKGIQDFRGYSYYVSYPPFGFIFPYIFFKLFFITPSVFGLHIFNILLSFAGAFALYLTISLIGKHKWRDGLYFPGVIVFSLYLFSKIALWYQSNVYFLDMLAQALMTGGIYLVVLYFTKENPSKRLIYWIGILTFFIAYTEWIGFFFAISILILCVSRFQQHRLLIFVVVTAASASLLMTLTQYSLIEGPAALFTEMKTKYLIRSGFDEAKSEYGITIYNPDSRRALLEWYKQGFSQIIFIIEALAVIAVVVSRSVRKLFTKLEGTFLLLCLLPVAMHHIIFFNFTVIHEFSVVKGATFLAALAAILYSKINSHLGRKSLINGILALYIVYSAITVSSLEYIQANPPMLAEYEINRTLGQFIANQVMPDETLFTNHTYIDDPMLIYYAKRNIIFCDSLTCAQDYLHAHNLPKGAYISVTGELQIENIQRFN
ncbi:MAG: hypothetical protein M3Q44_07635 [bacterium]|nr:hypothetical protein [bacterium]